MKKYLSVVILLILFNSQVLSVQAAEFSVELEDSLATMAVGDYLTVILYLDGPIDIQLLDAQLHERKAGRAERYKAVWDALHFNMEQTQPKLIAELENEVRNRRVRTIKSFWIDNIFIVEGTKLFIESLRERGDIKAVGANQRFSLIEPVESSSGPQRDGALDEFTATSGLWAIGAQRVLSELGFDGSGTLIANLDSGVDGMHPALATRWRGASGEIAASECWFDPVDNTNQPTDHQYHGTHVMGIMCGLDVQGSDSVLIGVAPGARWIAAGAGYPTADGRVQFTLEDVIASFQWLANPDGDLNTITDVPDIVNNSWGGGYSWCLTYYSNAILNLEALGTVVVFAAGNSGPSAATIGSPANLAYNETQVFAVGNVNSSDFASPYPIYPSSSRGPTLCIPSGPLSIKPEIVAPGTLIKSAYPGGSYLWATGTSMAAPHVSGTIALMRQACPDCDPQTIKEALMETAHDFGQEGADNEYGSGFLDAYAAVLSVRTDAPYSLTIHSINGDIRLNWSDLPGTQEYFVHCDSVSGFEPTDENVIAVTLQSEYLDTTVGEIESSSRFFAITRDVGQQNSRHLSVYSPDRIECRHERLAIAWDIQGSGLATIQIQKRALSEENWTQLAEITDRTLSSWEWQCPQEDSQYVQVVAQFLDPPETLIRPIPEGICTTTRSCSLAVISPLDPVGLHIGDTFTVEWTTGDGNGWSPVDSFDVLLNSEDGLTNTLLISGLAPSSRSSTAFVPPLPSSNYRFMVRANLPCGSSEEALSHTISIAPAAINIQVPAGNQDYENCQELVIEWSLLGGAWLYIDQWGIYYSSDNGLTFPYSVPDHQSLHLALTRSYSWLVPSCGVPYVLQIIGLDYQGNIVASGMNSGGQFQVLSCSVPGPVNLRTDNIWQTTIDLRWDDTRNDELDWRIARSTDGTNFDNIAVLEANSITYRVSGLTCGTPYWFKARATLECGYSQYSDVLFVATRGAPESPSNLRTYNIWQAQIDLRWDDNSGNEDYFWISQSSDGSNYTNIAHVGPDTVTHRVTGLTCGTPYWFRVRAANECDFSEYAPTLNVSTRGVPTSPTSLVASNNGRTFIDMSWTDNSDNEDEFRIASSTDGSNFPSDGTTVPNDNTYRSTGLSPNTWYWFRVRARNECGVSGWTNTIHVRTNP